ncbi:MAG: ribonuclease P protein component [Candidatus Saccharibacteria bacterium]
MNKLVLLKNSQDFSRFQGSRPFYTTALKLRIAVNTNQNKPRFGFIVPKKVFPKVVDRNKIKRRLKTLFLKHQQQLKPLDLLVFPGKKALFLRFPDLEREFLTLSGKANLWKR